MPPTLLFDLDRIDLSKTHLSCEQIYDLLPHRHEFQLLDRVCHVDVGAKQVVAVSMIEDADWWTRCHFPGRPLLPGVLMLEMAAQCMAVLAKCAGGFDDLIAFGGIEACKFREAVAPPSLMYLLGQGIEHRPRRVRSYVQGVVDRRVVFEALVTGLAMR